MVPLKVFYRIHPYTKTDYRLYLTYLKIARYQKDGFKSYFVQMKKINNQVQ